MTLYRMDVLYIFKVCLSMPRINYSVYWFIHLVIAHQWLHFLVLYSVLTIYRYIKRSISYICDQIFSLENMHKASWRTGVVGWQGITVLFVFLIKHCLSGRLKDTCMGGFWFAIWHFVAAIENWWYTPSQLVICLICFLGDSHVDKILRL